jgi:hypothetical protein
MAASYSSINVYDTTIADIVTALTAKSLITANLYQSATILIFTSPISTKYIKFVVSSGGIVMSYGDGQSGSNLTGTIVTINGYYSTPLMSGVHMVCDTNFFCIITETTGGSQGNFIYYGVTDSGKEITFGLYGDSSYYRYTTNVCKNITDGTTMYPVVWSTHFNDGGQEMTQGLMWRDASSGQILKNGVNPAITVGVKNVSMRFNYTLKASNYIVYLAPSYITTFGGILTAVLVDFS